MKLKKYLIGIFVLVVLFTLGFFLLNKKVIASTSSQIRTKEILEDKFYEPKFNINSASPLSYEAKKQLTIDQGSNNKEYLSAVICPDFQFGLLGFKWEGQEQAEPDIQIEVRFLDKNNNWTKWVAVEKDDNSTGRDTKIQTKISEPVISPESVAFQYKIELTRNAGRSPSLDFLKFTCIDSSESIAQKISNKLSKSFSQAEAASTAGVNIISRAGWGCPDPNNTMFAGTGRYWPAEYVHWQKVIIHHTVTTNNDPNPDQTVRNIWQYHAISNDWGDIGYNFLVSADGRVYQGRFGNNNVVGGHARPYNYGTIGIAVLGDYSYTGITAAGAESLTSLIAQKCQESGFMPIGSSNFAPTSPDNWGRTMFYNMLNIVGHRDCAPTACPGDILYSQLPGIRAASQNKIHPWQIISQTSDKDLTKLKPGDVANVTLTAKNTSNNTWSKSGGNSVRLGTWAPMDRQSAFYVSNNWLSPNRAAIMNEASVAPGANATFNFQMKAPNRTGAYMEKFNLVYEGYTWMNDTGLGYYCVVSPPTYSWQMISQTADKDLTKLKPGDVAVCTLTAKNTGNTTWSKSGGNPIRLGTSHPNDRASAFYVAGNWLAPNRPVTMNENSVTPGANATFSFQMKAPAQPGTYFERFNLLAEGITWMNDTGLGYYCKITPTYTWQFIFQTASKSLVGLSPGETVTITLTAKNTGNTAWFRTGSNPVRVGTTNPRDRSSAFANGTWLGPNRPVGLPVGTDSVAPGGTVTFSWTYTAPAAGGVYREYFSLLVEGACWMNDPGINYYTYVPPVRIYGNLGCIAKDVNGNVLGQGGNGQTLSAGYANGVYYLNSPSSGTISTSSPIRFYPAGGHLILTSYYDPNWNGSANYNEFRGIIEVRYSPASNKVWAINELSMEDYLKGIAETNSGHPEYIKSMIVVARSYAYWHLSRGGKHPGEPFILKNSRRGNGNDQVYCGYGFEYRVSGWPNSSLMSAINTTSKQVVAGYGYSVCITPYSHGARGSTRPGSAIGLNYPWLQAESDPYGDPNAGLNSPSGNHLVGLSASGASGYANRGSSYQNILAHYYRGTGLNTLGNPAIRIAIYGI